MKSIFLALVLVVSLILTLTSCGNGTPSNSIPGSSNSGDQEGTGMGPLPGSPANESHMASQNPEFHWQSMPSAVEYEFQLSSQKDFSSITFTNKVPTAAITIPDTMKLDQGGTYYWRVRLSKPSMSKWSDVSSLIID